MRRAFQCNSRPQHAVGSGGLNSVHSISLPLLLWANIIFNDGAQTVGPLHFACILPCFVLVTCPVSSWWLALLVQIQTTRTNGQIMGVGMYTCNER